jgi:hypothetical protein
MKKKKGSYPVLNYNRMVTNEEWIEYEKRYAEWDEKHPNKLTMEAAMSKPNPPNYFKANND